MLVRLIGLAIPRPWLAIPCWAEERPVIENSIGMKLVSIPAGEFLMGGTEKEVASRYKVARTAILEKAEKGGRKSGMDQALYRNVRERKATTPGSHHQAVLPGEVRGHAKGVCDRSWALIPARYAATARNSMKS